MDEKETERADLERACQGVSRSDEPCDYSATVHCATCGRWFCAADAEDDEWHPCMCHLEKRAARHRAPSIDPAVNSERNALIKC
jgi:hypothetical protein